ncbi:MAG: 50S ribosomal protein L22 [Bacteroidia bacterium]
MEAVSKYINSPHSPRKMRLLADIIRGLPVEKALYTLKLHPKKAYAKEMEKVLLSAIANWQEKNEELSIEESGLTVKTITVDGGRVLKRIQPAPQGRAHRIRKRYNHITITVDGLVSETSEVAEVEEISEETES